MPRATKSAIRECRDQLFLNRAVGQYLSNVTSNLGVSRPLLGFSNDDLWRALIRRLALDYRQVANLFYDWLTEYLGPRVTAVTVLAEAGENGEIEFTLTSPELIPQQGTLVLNEGLGTEQTISYSFRDPKSGVVSLSTALTADVPAVVNNVIGYMSADASSGATTLNLIDSTEFPVADFPYTLLLDAGTANEEAVNLTAHALLTDPLTVSATTKDHFGPTPSSVVAELQAVAGGDIVLTLDETEDFPATGVVRVSDPGGTPTETVEYTTHDFDNNQLILKYALTNSYTTGANGASVTLMRNGTSVQLAQVQVKSADWDIFQTEPNKLQIYISDELTKNRLQDVSYLHDTIIGAAPSTTLAANASAGDKTILLTDASTFPTSGTILVDAELISFDRVDRFQTNLLIGGTGATTLYVQNAKILKALALWTEDRTLTLSRGLAPEETVTWTTIDEAANTVTLAAATTNTHAAFATVETGNPHLLYLSRDLASAHLLGVTVAITADEYGGTDLEIGDPTVAPTNSHRYQGSYMYSFVDLLADSSVQTTLTENLSGPLELQIDQIAGAASLEVVNADLLESTGQFNARVGRGRGSNEETNVAGLVLQRVVEDAGLTLSAIATAGDRELVLQAGEGAQLPQPPGGSYLYRVLVDKGGANEEVVIVQSIATDTLTLAFAMTKGHVATETVELMADVIELSDTLTFSQLGRIKLDERFLTSGWLYREEPRRAHVEEIRTEIAISSVTGLPTAGGTVLVNFGNQRIMVEKQIATAASKGDLTIVLDESDDFPTSFPYFVEINPGTAQAEVRSISSNTVGTETLGLTGTIGLDYDHPIGTTVRYSQGEFLTLNYTGVDTGPDRLLFEDGTLIPHHLMSGLSIILSKISSNSQGDGLDYPFYMPLSFSERLALIASRGRAAGVEVEVISNK